MATGPGTLDPRTLPDAQPPADERDIRPVVPVRRGGLPGWMLAIFALCGAVLLFMVLDTRRRALTAPDERGGGERVALPAPPPPLVIPPDDAPPEPALVVPVAVPQPPPQPQPAPASAPMPQPRIVYVPQPTPASPVRYEPIPPVLPDPPRGRPGPAIVIDTPSAPTAAGPITIPFPGGPNAGPVLGNRARSSVFANRSSTVVQGTLIPAVLETALDSTRPGAARAIVSRDVRGFDGSQVVIPRGSRLIGEYRTDTAPGQRRAMVNWVRLIRPDGVTIAIGSPAGDPLGRGGIRARVNSHFLERFGNALLQSVLQIGGSIAIAEVATGAIIAAPGLLTGGGTGQLVPQTQVTPTLTVRPGTSISIFVARDLDFTGTGA